jgi:hypothetical protein
MATAKPDNDPATPTDRPDRPGRDVDLDELNRRAAEAGAKATSADARQTRTD